MRMKVSGPTLYDGRNKFWESSCQLLTIVLHATSYTYEDHNTHTHTKKMARNETLNSLTLGKLLFSPITLQKKSCFLEFGVYCLTFV